MNLLKKAYDPQRFRDEAHKIVDILADYLEKTKNSEYEKVLPFEEPEEMYRKWKPDLDKSEELDSFFSRVLDDTIHMHHPRYMGHQVCAPVPVAGISSFFASVINNGQAIFEMGPVGSVMERIVIEFFAKKYGLPKETYGVMTSGGTAGNLTALLAARQAMADYNVWEEGNKTNRQLAVMVSEHAHYSVDRAIKIMGLGESGIIKLPVDENYRVKPESLEAAYQKAKEQGVRVFACVANVCSTATGSYDPLNAIADFCKKHTIWLHADGAHGGAAIFSEKYKHLLDGIHRVDSMIVDFHKMMMTPALATMVLFRDGKHTYETFAQKASYLLQDKPQGEWYNSANRSLECTKYMIPIRIYTILKMYGEQLITENIERTHELAEIFVKKIKATDDFEIAIEPQTNIVCFRYIPDENLSDAELSKLNTSKRKKTVENGEYYIVQTDLKGVTWLRVSLMNPFTTEKEMNGLLEFIRKV